MIHGQRWWWKMGLRTAVGAMMSRADGELVVDRGHGLDVCAPSARVGGATTTFTTLLATRPEVPKWEMLSGCAAGVHAPTKTAFLRRWPLL